MERGNDEHLAGQSDLARALRRLDQFDFANLFGPEREEILTQYPDGLAKAMAADIEHECKSRPEHLPGYSLSHWRSAHRRLIRTHQRYMREDVPLSDDVGRLELQASRYARKALNTIAQIHQDRHFDLLVRLVESRGLSAPKVGTGGVTERGAIRRMCDPAWWKRRLRRKAEMAAEAAARAHGLVSNETGLFASDDAVARHRRKRRYNQLYLEEHCLVSEYGEYLELADAAASNVSNPRIRVAEMMGRARGTEEYAKAMGLDAWFITATCPSRFHRQLSSGGRNPRFDGSTPADGQRWLCRNWSRIRAEMMRAGISPIGFRVAEPNHDATPHWHMLLFVRKEHSEKFRQIIFDHFLADSGDEPGAKKARVQFERIDMESGSATGYIAKYLSKNIDGSNVGIDYESGSDQTDCAESVERVLAWAATWGTRQFQGIGQPPVTVWRELRRVNTSLCGRAEDLRIAADAGDWQAFIELCGGPGASRILRGVSILRVETESMSHYDDEPVMAIAGVVVDSLEYLCRDTRWQIWRKADLLGPWTRENNCTVERLTFLPLRL